MYHLVFISLTIFIVVKHENKKYHDSNPLSINKGAVVIISTPKVTHPSVYKLYFEFRWQSNQKERLSAPMLNQTRRKGHLNLHRMCVFYFYFFYFGRKKKRRPLDLHDV